MDFTALAAALILLFLSGAQAHLDNRCPDIPPFSTLVGGNSSGDSVLVSGSGLGVSCDELELELRQQEGVLPAFNYYCNHVFSPSPDCVSESCDVCGVLRACGVPATPFDLCSSDILLSCTAVPDIPFVKDLYLGVCVYAVSMCLNGSSTGICESRQLIETCSFYGPWPCDCFLPNATCDLCELVLPLCPNISGSGMNNSGSGVDGSGVDEFCSFLQSEGGIGLVFLCQTFLPGEPCPFSDETCSFCFYINFGGCGDLSPVSVSDLCALPTLVTTCDFPSVVAESDFFTEICSYIAVSDCGGDGSSCVGDHCHLCNYLGSDDGLGYVFLCQSIPIDGYCPYSNETCIYCEFIALGACTELPNVTQSDLCKLSILVSTCEDFRTLQYGTEINFLSDICPFTSICTGPSGGFVSGDGSGFFGSGNDSYFCSEVGAGFVYFCLLSSVECSSNFTCDICELLLLCPDLSPPSTRDVCSDFDSVFPCIGDNEDLRDYCSGIMGLCLTSDDSGICELEDMINNCTQLITLGACVIPELIDICSNCYSVLNYCMLNQSVSPNFTDSVSTTLTVGTIPTTTSSLQITAASVPTAMSTESLSIAAVPTSGIAESAPTASILVETIGTVSVTLPTNQVTYTSPVLAAPTSSLIQALPTTSSPIQALPTTSSPIQALPTTSSLIQALPTTSSPIQALPTTSSPIQALPTTSSPIQALPTTSSPIQALPTTSSPIQALPTTSSPIQALPTTSSPIQALTTSNPALTLPTSSPIPAVPTSSPAETMPISSPVEIVPASSSVEAPTSSAASPLPTTSTPVQVEPSSSYVEAESTSSPVASSAVASSSEPSTMQPSPTASTSTFPEGTAIEVDNLSEEQAENTVSLVIESITVAGFLEKELSFRMSIADALNKGIDVTQKKRQDEEFTADDIKYVGQPVKTDSGGVLVAFFVEYPDGQQVVDGRELARVLDDNSKDISDAAGGRVQGIKKGVPAALHPEGKSPTDSDDDGGLSGGSVAAIVLGVLVVAALLAVVVVGAVLVWLRRNRRSFEIMTSAKATTEADTSGGESGRRGRNTGRSFPLRSGSNTYVAVPGARLATNKGVADDGDKGEDKDGATEKVPLEEGPKITHL